MMTGTPSVVRFDAGTGAALGTLAQGLAAAAGSLLLASDGSLVAALNGAGVTRYSLDTGNPLYTYPTTGGPLAGLNAQAETTTTVTVGNVTPSVVIHAAPPAIAGDYTFTSSVTDPGTLDTASYLWTVTGGTAVGSTTNPGFTFTPTTGAINVSLTVTDEDHAAGSSTVLVILGTPLNDNIVVANPAAGISRVIVFGLAGDDTIDASNVTAVPVELIGGFGNDTLIGGSKDDILYGNTPGDYALVYAGDTGNDTLIAGPGNVILDGGLGNDLMVGGAGNDTFIEVPGSADIIDASKPHGTATIDYSQAYAGVTFSLATTGAPQVVNPSAPPAGQHTVEILGTIQNLLGTSYGDSLTGNSSSNLLDGGGGDDVLYGGTPLDTLTGAIGSGNDSLIGGSGNDTVIGGSGNDVIYGGTQLDTLPGAVSTGNDSLIGGAGNDTIFGGAGNDVIYGGSGNDLISGGGGTDVAEGGCGADTLLETRDANMILGPTTLTIGVTTERFYDIEKAILNGGASDNLIDASTFPGPVSLYGSAGNDTLIGGAFSDFLAWGAGNDSLVGNGGDDIFNTGSGNDAAVGGTGNDTYILTSGGNIALTDPAGIDSIDLSGASFAVNVDLAVIGVPQAIDTSGTVLTLNGTFENLVGSSYNDTIKGNSARNIIDGGGGVDYVEGRAGDDTLQGGYPQVVYLDFDSATGPGEKVYSVAERNTIQANLEKLYASPFSVTFTQNAPAVGKYLTILVNVGGSASSEALVGGQAAELDWRSINLASSAAINVNGFLGRKGQPAATSANYVALTSTIVAHELGHLLGLQHSDAFGPIGRNPATGLPYGIYTGLVTKDTVAGETDAGTPAAGILDGKTLAYTLLSGPVLLGPVTQAGTSVPVSHPAPSGTVFEGVNTVATFSIDTSGLVHAVNAIGASHTVTGGTLDPNSGVLTLTWAWHVAPVNTSINIRYDYDSFSPGYRGPLNAVETTRHVMASPASVGTSVTDSLGSPYFGERELIKLAFDDTSSTAQSSSLAASALPIGIAGVGRNLGTLPALAVPNLLPVGAANYGKTLNVRAESVVGAITIDPATSQSTNDVYTIQGKAGDFLNAEVLSASLPQRFGGGIDAILRVYDSSGNLLDYYGQPAVNDDGLDNKDAQLFDVRLPSDGTYYVMVDTFTSATVPDTATGGYELFLYTYTDPSAAATRDAGIGDTLVGGTGTDVIIGSAGDDRLVVDPSKTTFLNPSPYNTIIDLRAVLTSTVLLSPVSPTTDGLLTATAAVTSPGNVAYTVTYTWKVNGVTVRTTAGTTSLIDTLDLSLAENGDKGDAVSVEFSATNGSQTSNVATAVVTVIDSAPTATVTLNSTSPRTNDTLTASATTAYADADPVTLTYVWKVNGNIVRTHAGSPSSTDTFDLSLAGHGDKGDAVTVEVTPYDGTLAGPIVTATAVVAPTPPTATDGTATVLDTTAGGVVIDLTALVTDVETPPINLVYTIVTPPPSNQGTLTPVAGQNGRLTFVPAAGFLGNAVFNYKATDPTAALDSDTKAVTVTVSSDYRLPVINTVANDGPGVVGGTLNVTVAATDPQGYALTFSYDFNNDGIYEVGPQAPNSAMTDFAAAGNFTVGVKVSDGHGSVTGSTNVVINPATVTVVLNAGQSPSTYGQGVTFTASVSPQFSGTPGGTVQFQVDGNAYWSPVLLANGVAIITAAATDLKAGSRAITAVYSGSADFRANLTTISQTVNKASLTVTANNAVKTYGDANPALSGTVTGVVSGDAITAQYATGALTFSPVGGYAITPTLTDPANRLGNYAVTVNPGTLSVSKRALTVTPTNQNIGHGDSLPYFGYNISGFVNNETASVITGTPVLRTPATPTSPAGVYPINENFAAMSATNYSFTPAPATITVHPKVVDVRVRYGTQSTSILGLNRDLPFSTITGLEVIYSDNVQLPAMSALTLPTRSGTAAPPAFTAVATNGNAANDLIWSVPLLTPLGIDMLTASLDASKISSNVNGVTIGLYGTTLFDFDILPGDFNGDRVVKNDDLVGVRNATGATNVWADLNGDGTINAADAVIAQKKVGTKLP